jgi:hypothetical protein
VDDLALGPGVPSTPDVFPPRLVPLANDLVQFSQAGVIRWIYFHEIHDYANDFHPLLALTFETRRFLFCRIHLSLSIFIERAFIARVLS